MSVPADTQIGGKRKEDYSEMNNIKINKTYDLLPVCNL
jgi:hypothetical protein